MEAGARNSLICWLLIMTGAGGPLLRSPLLDERRIIWSCGQRGMASFCACVWMLCLRLSKLQVSLLSLPDTYTRQ